MSFGGFGGCAAAAACLRSSWRLGGGDVPRGLITHHNIIPVSTRLLTLRFTVMVMNLGHRRIRWNNQRGLP